MIAGTLGFGVGRITDAPVVRDGRIEIAARFTLSLAFDIGCSTAPWRRRCPPA